MPFYTELGYVEEFYTDRLYLRHSLAGLEYAMGQRIIATLK